MEKVQMLLEPCCGGGQWFPTKKQNDRVRTSSWLLMLTGTKNIILISTRQTREKKSTEEER